MRHASGLAAATLTALILATAARASDLCPDEQPTEQIPPKDPAYCANLDAAMRHPGAVPLDQVEHTLDDFISHYCHRRLANHWAMDKTVRDAGPFVATLANGAWTGNDEATHMPVLIWYSPEMVNWLKKYRTPGHTTPNPPPIPDGAIMIKEMYNSTPAAACRVPDLLKLKPVEQGAAVMIRDSKAAKDGWFWGWYGWPDVKSGWHVDYPPVASSPLPFMGFGQYCLNCHASARDNQTFASPDNIRGQPGSYLSFLSQDFYQTQSFGIQAPVKGPETAVPSEHLKILAAARMPTSMGLIKLRPSSTAFLAALNLRQFPPISPDQADTLKMPSQTYDNVWVAGRGPKEAHAFVTSDQCVGCHSAGGTGLQFVMTAPIVTTGQPSLYNFSPYGTWRTSPMGLAAAIRSSSPNLPVRPSPSTRTLLQPCRPPASAATASRVSVSSPSTRPNPARPAPTSCARWSTLSLTPPTRCNRISAAWPGTASPARLATTWSSARPTPPATPRNRKTAASSSASNSSTPTTGASPAPSPAASWSATRTSSTARSRTPSRLP